MKIKALTLALASLALAASAWSASISTGVAPWLVNGNPVAVESTIPVGIWIPNFGDGSWVGTSTTDGTFAPGTAPGSYVFSLNIGALIGEAGSLNFSYATDNSVQWSLTNGSLSGTTSCLGPDCFTSPGAPRLVSGSFNANSVLTATVVNEGSAPNPMGLLVVGEANTIPEPATYLMFALGSAAILIGRRRK